MKPKLQCQYSHYFTTLYSVIMKKSTSISTQLNIALSSSPTLGQRKVLGIYMVILLVSVSPVLISDESMFALKWLETFLVLGQWHLRMTLFLIVLERTINAFSPNNLISQHLANILICSGACLLPCVGLSYCV